MLNYKRNIELLQDMEEYVAGHMEAKKALITLVNRSKRRHLQKFGMQMGNEYLLSPSKVLLLGASGTGKTHLVESLQKIVTFPLIKLDATKLNPTGASGGIKEKDVQDLIAIEARAWVANSKYAGAEYSSVEGTIDQMVVFIDEIDKLGRSFDSSGNWNTHVQSNFLTLFDNKEEYAGVSFIFAGAFTSITGEEAEKKTSIGFHRDTTVETGKKKNMDELLVKAGLIPELVGRLTNIVELDKFTEEDFYQILKTRLHPKKEIDMAHLGIFDLQLDEIKGRAMAAHAYKSGQGIRALQRQLEKEYADLEFMHEEDQYLSLEYLGLTEE